MCANLWAIKSEHIAEFKNFLNMSMVVVLIRNLTDKRGVGYIVNVNRSVCQCHTEMPSKAIDGGGL